jgi:hypothetical protein
MQSTTTQCKEQEAEEFIRDKQRVMVKEITTKLGFGHCCTEDESNFGTSESLFPLGSWLTER